MTKQSPGRSIVIYGDRLIDGTGQGQALDQPAVLVRDGKVAQVFQGALPTGLDGPDPEVLEFPGCSILPGLIDAHVHLDLPGDGTPFADSVLESDEVFVANAAFGARTALDAGITTLRDTGARGVTTFGLRRALALGYGVGPRLVLCGQPLTVTGGHIWYFGGEADGVDALRRKVREMAKLGADFIKVVGSGGGTPNTITWRAAYGRSELEAVVEESHRLNRRVTVHCLCAEAISQAVDAGVDQIEHAGFIVDDSSRQEYDPKVAVELAASGIPVTSTLAVAGYGVRTLRDKDTRSPTETASLDRWSRMLEANLVQTGALRDAGVEFVAGTDAGWSYTPFDALPDEVVLLQEAGATAAEAIHAATGGAAKALGLGDHIGTVQAGSAADILVVKGNPLQDLRALRDVKMVMRDGNVHRREAVAVGDPG